MSSVASLYIVKTNDLPAIVSAAGSARVREAFHQFGEELDEESGWSGYVMPNILEITLIASDVKALLDRLDPAEARYAMEETLSLLRDTIARLSDDEVLLLHIG